MGDESGVDHSDESLPEGDDVNPFYDDDDESRQHNPRVRVVRVVHHKAAPRNRREERPETRLHYDYEKGVEELAFLIKDNLPCKHLVLSMEEALVNVLEDNTSTDGLLELEPMSSYNRLLLHRLADIFGFAHESVGEGDDRHLILERCPESSIPSILVSDILWQYDEYQPSTSHQILKRTEDLPVLMTKPVPFQSSLEEREAAYLAARERIFSMSESETKEAVTQKPRNIPVVARRMIAHALGQRINSSNQEGTLRNSEEYEEKNVVLNILEKDKVDTSSSLAHETILLPSQNLSSCGNNICDKPTGKSTITSASQSEKKMHKKPADNISSSGGVPQSGSTGRVVYKDNLKEEHLGAAKRMFAHALGLRSARENQVHLLKCTESKQILKSFKRE
ncbi:hypothetical protein HHK36_020135 [Tetracentron sinense]|uniref:R3H domain-containing protein n=1 Tax=Tetracentron sinense TaxID=13715 RepID=A0A835D7R9_TETSI|nr:hypothetical protein HHK36_020135 [Tetracentron sinense]